jgi:hypothetical protein
MDDARLNNITLECETIDESFDMSIAKYEFPYSDDAVL